MTNSYDLPSLAEQAAEYPSYTIDVAAPPNEMLAVARGALASEIREDERMLRDRVGNELFRNGVLVRIARDDDGEPVLAPHTTNTMTELLSQRAWFVRRGQGDAPRTVAPPASLVKQVLDAPDVLDVPVVEQLVSSPVFGPSGELVTEPGLLRDARAWYEATDGMKLAWEVPEEPTAEHVAYACSWIDELFCDFPFATKADRANAWALLLQPFVRPMIAGPTPLFDVESPTAGTGKGKLVRAALLPALGYEVAAHQVPSDNAEWRKTVIAFLLKGKSVFLLDNVNERLDSGVLASALTEPRVEDRILGASKIVTLPVRCTWVMTANNPRLSQEIARRAVQIRLDARVARPQERDGFRHDPLETWARDNRGQLAWSALTLVRAWLAAGRPRGSVTMGSYESWCHVLGGVLDVAGLGADFLGNREAFWTDHMDEESDETCAALDHWWATFRDRPVGAREVADVPVSDPAGGPPVTLADLLLGGRGEGPTRQARRVMVGNRLRDLTGRVLCEYRVESAGTSKGRKLYVLRRGGGD